MNFNDIIKNENTPNTDEILMEEGFLALARVYRQSHAGFMAEGFDKKEADRLSFKLYLSYLKGDNS